MRFVEYFNKNIKYIPSRENIYSDRYEYGEKPEKVIGEDTQLNIYRLNLEIFQKIENFLPLRAEFKIFLLFLSK